MDLATRMHEDQRLIILRTLACDACYRLNDSLLLAALASMGHDISGAALHAQLDWLEDAMLLEGEAVRGVRIATLTQRGLDVASGRARASGVARPRPGDNAI